MKKCIQTEARSKTDNDSWTVTRYELLKFIVVMHGSVILAKGQPVNSLWSKKWGSRIFQTLMSRNRFKEIMRYVRFDIRSS